MVSQSHSMFKSIWSLPCGLDPLPRVSILFLKRLHMHCPTTWGPVPKHILPTDEFTSSVTKHNQCSGTTQRRSTEFSSAGVNGLTRCLGRASLIAKRLLKPVRALSHPRAEAPLGPVSRDTGVCRGHRRGPLLVCPLTRQLRLCYFCPACLPWLTPDISLKLRVTGIQKSHKAQPGTAEGTAHCLVQAGLSTARREWAVGFS